MTGGAGNAITPHFYGVNGQFTLTKLLDIIPPGSKFQTRRNYHCKRRRRPGDFRRDSPPRALCFVTAMFDPPCATQMAGHPGWHQRAPGHFLSYLEQLFGKLRRAELVESIRGPGGGYRLARLVEDITVADIIIAVDEPLDATQCGGHENCHDNHRC